MMSSQGIMYTKVNKRSEMISVVVPAYNASATLQRCIESVEAQSYSNLEILIIDDGSTDGTRELAVELSEADKRIVVISQANAGRSAARNRGIEAAIGDWVIFLDSDDYLFPNALENLFPTAADVDVIWSGYDTPSGRYGVSGERVLLDSKTAVLAITNPSYFRRVC